MTDDDAPGPPELSRSLPPNVTLRPERTGLREPAKWILGALLAAALGTLLVTLALANVTAEGPAKRSLKHSIAILTEVDGLLDDHYETLRLEAESAEGQLTLPQFPIEVSFSPEEVRDTSRAEFRDLLLTRAAAHVHEHGIEVMREGREGGAGFFSTEGAIRTSLDFLRPTPHRVLTILTIALASAAGVLALALALVTRGYGRVLAVGATALVAALPFLVAAVAVRFAFRVSADGLDEYLAREFFELGSELAWAPIRNGIVVASGGAILFVVGLALSRWNDLRRV